MTHYFNNAAAAFAALALSCIVMAYAIVPAEHVAVIAAVA